MSMYSYCMFMYLHRASWHSSATLTEVFPCFFLSCKANTRVKPANTGHGPHSSKLLCCSMYCFVTFCVLFVCKCVLYYCHLVATQLRITNISSIASIKSGVRVKEMLSLKLRHHNAYICPAALLYWRRCGVASWGKQDVGRYDVKCKHHHMQKP